MEDSWEFRTPGLVSGVDAGHTAIDSKGDEMTRRVIFVVPVAAFALLDESGARGWVLQESDEAPALQIFVSPGGNDDDNSGLSPQDPILTLKKAQEIIDSHDTEEQPLLGRVEVRIAPGRYHAQTVTWTQTHAERTIVFMPVHGPTTPRPVFDGCPPQGECPGGTFFTLDHDAGQRTNVHFEYIRVENYQWAVVLQGNRNAAGASNSNNRIYGCYFYRIGNLFNPSLSRSTAVVSLVNSDDNLIRNNHFIDIFNVTDEGEPSGDNSLHAVYNAHMSDRNVISYNRFQSVASDPVDIRDNSRDNLIVHNIFTRTGNNAAAVDWYCRHGEKGYGFWDQGQEEPWSGFGTRGGRGWYLGDYDGDGRDDILRYVNHSGGAEVFLSRRSEAGHDVGFFAPAGQWTGAGVRGGEGWYVGDYNGDRKDDILRYINRSGGADVYLSTGSSFSHAGTWSGFGTRGGRGWYVGDFNGDGKDDILRYLNASGGAEVMLSTGAAFQYAGTWTSAVVHGGEGWYVGDYNGDGKDDILRYQNQHGGAEVFLSNGAWFSYAGTWSGFGTRGGRGWYVGDYDGDGRDDLLRYALSGNGGAQVLLNPGSHFAGPSPHSWSEEEVEGGEGWYVGDFDGDGRPSILRYINASGGARVLTQRCSKRTPECPSWNTEFSDNVLDGNFECNILEATHPFQSSTPPPGCPAPPDGGLRFLGGGNLDDGVHCSGPRNGRR
jgi:FG-GAP-like repeat